VSEYFLGKWLGGPVDGGGMGGVIRYGL
jgi:hypothetical protein